MGQEARPDSALECDPALERKKNLYAKHHNKRPATATAMAMAMAEAKLGTTFSY
jgi:hypothetical protein